MENQRSYHRPISMTIERVEAMPELRKLPMETQMTINLKGDRENGLKLIAEIQRQIDKVDFFAVTIEGPS